MANYINRRKFFRDSALSAAGIMLGSNMTGSFQASEPNEGSFTLMKEVLKYRKIDAHEHVGLGDTVEQQIDFADRLGIEKLVVSKPISADSKIKATPEEFRQCNDAILDAMRRFPGRYLGLLFINPLFGKESLEEIDRCLGNGMIGLKVYNQVKINDPLFYPIIEKFIDLKMIILMHSHCGLGVGGKRTKYGNIQPLASIPEDFVDAAKRYPEAMFQYAHTGGGGDWEYACKAIKDYPNIYVDTSGSNNEGNMINFALECLGEDRLFFGTDGSYYQGISGIFASSASEFQKKKILFDNYNRILAKSGHAIS